MLPDKLQRKIEYEISEIDRLLNDFEPLLLKVKQTEPDLVEISAIASLLHSFYNGIEKIFEFIAIDLDGSLPQGASTHKKLLIQMAQGNEKRDALISEEIVSQLVQYLGFRHFFRHSYSFQLDWNKMKPLVDDINKFWDELKTIFSF